MEYSSSSFWRITGSSSANRPNVMTTQTAPKEVKTKRAPEEDLSPIPANRVTVATVRLRGISSLSFGRHHGTPKLSEDENPDAYERRTFRQKAHYVPETGELFIPPMMLKKTLELAAAYLGMKIPGKGKSTYTQRFKSGLLVADPIMLGIKLAEAREEGPIFVSSTGKPNSGSRVMRYFPTVDQWEASATVTILDGVITSGVFERVLAAAGRFIGLGRFRAAVGGYYGRFEVLSVSYQTLVG